MIVHCFKILDALECAKHYQTSVISQDFIINHIVQITYTLINVTHLSEAEKDVSYKAIYSLLDIINSGIKKEDFDCTSLLESLAIIFRAEGRKSDIKSIFRQIGGFDNISNYLVSKVVTPIFPNIGVVLDLLTGSWKKEDIRATKDIAEIIMKHILSINEDAMKKINSVKSIDSIRIHLFQVYLKLSKVCLQSMNHFLTFMEKWAMKLVACEDTNLKRFGLAFIVKIVTRTPPLAYVITGARCIHINGTYDLNMQNDGGLWYQMSIPESYEADPEWSGKRLTLFRCVMRSQHKWWFISEADVDQPGTDKDIDYYQLKSRANVSSLPSPSGWLTCKAGSDPPPTVDAVRSEEYSTLELVNWTINNGILGLAMELSSNDSSIMSLKELISTVVCTNKQGTLTYLAKYLNSCTNEFPPLGMAPMLIDIVLESMSNNKHSSDAYLICKGVMEHLHSLHYEGTGQLRSNVVGGNDVFLYFSLYAITKHIPLLVCVFGLFQSMPKLVNPNNCQLQIANDNTKTIVETVMNHILGLDEDALEKVSTKFYSELRSQLLLISEIDMSMVSYFFDYWRRFALKLVKSQSIKVRCLGWNEINGLITESVKRRPPPNVIVVSEAGRSFFNGTYVLDPDRIASSGYLKPNTNPKYLRQVSADDDDDPEIEGTLSIWLSPNKWYLSDNKDTQYYEHQPVESNSNLLPETRWISRVGYTPAPIMKAESLAIPSDVETLEHQLAEWAMKNELIELAIGNSAHNELVPKSKGLIEFLAGNCDKYYSSILPSRLSLKASHLLLAQQTFTTTSDIIILTQLHILLLAVRPSLTDGLKEVISPIIKNAIMLRIERSDPSLSTLLIGDNYRPNQVSSGNTCIVAPSEGMDFPGLGRAVRSNTNLKTVSFQSTFNIGNNESGTETFFEGLKYNSSIKTLSIAGSDVSETAYIELLQAFRNRTTSLTNISIVNCGLDDGKIALLTPTIRRCTNLKEINLHRNNIEEAVLTELIPAIVSLEALVALDLSGNSIGSIGCNILANFLKDEGCQLQTLCLSNNQIDDTCTSLLVDALVKNNKLETLKLYGNDVTHNGLGPFVQVLCNTTTISHTYNSNHTLSSIGYDGEVLSEVEGLLYYLRLNRSQDKNDVATEKIIVNHNHFEMEAFFGWDSKGDSLKALPFVMDWFDRAEEVDEEDECEVPKKKLDAIYQFAQAMPLLFVPASIKTKVNDKKRKQDDI